MNYYRRRFGVFDHWFCEVPSQTLPNRSFWTAATSSGFAVNSPVKNFVQHNDAETIFNRLDDHGKTWKVYIALGTSLSTLGKTLYEGIRGVRRSEPRRDRGPAQGPRGSRAPGTRAERAAQLPRRDLPRLVPVGS
jgi:phospholipase C